MSEQGLNLFVVFNIEHSKANTQSFDNNSLFYLHKQLYKAFNVQCILFTFSSRGNISFFVAATQILTLLLTYSVCDVEKLKGLQMGDMGLWECINAL